MEEGKVITLAGCVSAYLEARKLDGYSDKTLYSYRLHLMRLVEDVGSTVPVDAVKLEHLRAHLTSLTHLQTSSLANKVRAPQSLLQMALRGGNFRA